MKYYDKYLTPISKEIQQTLIILAVFIIGFIAGYFMAKWEKQGDENQNSINNATATVMHTINCERIA